MMIPKRPTDVLVSPIFNITRKRRKYIYNKENYQHQKTEIGIQKYETRLIVGLKKLKKNILTINKDMIAESQRYDETTTLRTKTLSSNMFVWVD